MDRDRVRWGGWAPKTQKVQIHWGWSLSSGWVDFDLDLALEGLSSPRLGVCCRFALNLWCKIPFTWLQLTGIQFTAVRMNWILIEWSQLISLDQLWLQLKFLNYSRFQSKLHWMVENKRYQVAYFLGGITLTCNFSVLSGFLLLTVPLSSLLELFGLYTYLGRPHWPSIPFSCQSVQVNISVWIWLQPISVIKDLRGIFWDSSQIHQTYNVVM